MSLALQDGSTDARRIVRFHTTSNLSQTTKVIVEAIRVLSIIWYNRRGHDVCRSTSNSVNGNTASIWPLFCLKKTTKVIQGLLLSNRASASIKETVKTFSGSAHEVKPRIAPPCALGPAAGPNTRLVWQCLLRRGPTCDLLREAQLLRGTIYFEDGAIDRSHLTNGRHVVESDRHSWHLLVLDDDGSVSACTGTTITSRMYHFPGLPLRSRRLLHAPYGVKKSRARWRRTGIIADSGSALC